MGGGILNKLYFLDANSGELTSFSNEAAEHIGIFLYREEENLTTIEGECPLLYKTMKEAKKDYLDGSDLQSHLDEGLTVVIRKVMIVG